MCNFPFPGLQMHLFDIDIPGGIRFKESEVLSPGNSFLTFDTGNAPFLPPYLSVPSLPSLSSLPLFPPFLPSHFSLCLSRVV